MSEIAWPLTLYVDEACPLCRAEMAGLAARDRGACLRRVDCSGADFRDAYAHEAGLSQAQLLHRIHACDAQGRWLVGIAAFAAAYEAAGIHWFARLLRVRALRPLLDFAYARIVDKRPWLVRLGAPRLLAALLAKPAAPAACRRTGEA
jgi:predicted DCC family thiol-disulfide oxidoreductase YuxK